MHIYFHTRNIKFLHVKERQSIDLLPLANSNTANHFAFSIERALEAKTFSIKRAMEAKDLNQNIRKAFVDCMNQFRGTQNLLQSNPALDEFDFDASGMPARLAAHFILNEDDINAKVKCQKKTDDLEKLNQHLNLPRPLPEPSITWAQLHAGVDKITAETNAKIIPDPLLSLASASLRFGLTAALGIFSVCGRVAHSVQETAVNYFRRTP